MKRKATKGNGMLWLEDGQLAEMQMRAVQIAAGLPEPEPENRGGMMSGYFPGRPGKSADKVISDAAKIIAFVTKRA